MVNRILIATEAQKGDGGIGWQLFMGIEMMYLMWPA